LSTGFSTSCAQDTPRRPQVIHRACGYGAWRWVGGGLALRRIPHEWECRVIHLQ
jgi:hypothetical protein